MSTVLLTHAQQYTGPGIVSVLQAKGYQLFCHDASFIDAEARTAFTEETGAYALSAQSPDDIVDELQAHPKIQRFVLNNVYPNIPTPIEDLNMETLEAAFHALMLFPFRLAQLVLPELKKLGGGHIAVITSARQLQPEPGYALATSIRAGATAFATALAREAAPHNIQVNAIQPNYLYSELYYPKAKYIDDPAGRESIKQVVPMGRLGTPEEFGELLEFYISGRSPFTTGQVINFTGGWP